MRFVSFPVADRAVPASEAEVAAALEKLHGELSAGRNVVMHCRQGIGRTGLMAACLLVTIGWDPQAAVEHLSAVRGAAMPETAEQRRWIDRFAARAARTPSR